MSEQNAQPFLIIDHNGTKLDFARKICIGIARSIFIIVTQLIAVQAYLVFMLLLQPLKYVSTNLYWAIEGILYHGLLLLPASWQWSAGYTGKLFLRILCFTTKISIVLATQVFVLKTLQQCQFLNVTIGT